MFRSDPRPNNEHGFTFIELMVVLFILGLAATAVLLAIPDPGGSVYQEAERFAARAKAARDDAIVQSRSTGVRLAPSGYTVSIRQAGAWQETGRYEWAPGIRLQTSGGEEGGTRFDSTGLATPLQVVLERDEQRVAVDIAHDGSILVRR